MDRKTAQHPVHSAAWNTSALSLTNAVKQGALNIEGGLRKNWKKRWIILHGDYLYIYPDDGAEKPKDVILLLDITPADVSQVEGRDMEFRIRNPYKTYTFQALKAGEREAWMTTVSQKLKSIQDITTKYGWMGRARLESSLFIKIGEVRLTTQEPRDTYCTILADNLPKGRTPTLFETNNPFFNSEHEIELTDNHSITIQLKDHAIHKKRKGKHDVVGLEAKHDVIGLVVIPLSDLSNQKLNDAWYKLLPFNDIGDKEDGNNTSNSSNTNDTDDIGQVKLTTQLQESAILPDKSYNDLFALLVEKDCALTLKLAAVSAKKEKVVAECLVKSFELRQCAVHFIKKITEAEVQQTNDPNVIFRANTVCTKSVDMYLRLTGMAYLQHILKPFVTNLYQKDKKKSCELDPTRIDEANESKKDKVIKKNAKTLIGYVTEVFHAIKTSLSFCPMSFRNVFEHIHTVVSNKFKDNASAQYTAISGFIFLRFFCPALLTPKNFELATEDPPPSVARDLTLIVKTVQNLANLVLFGKKEPFMVVCNDFIESTKEDMKSFLTELSKPPTTAVDELPQKRPALNFGSEMARVHAHLSESKEALMKEFPNDPQVEKLAITLGTIEKEFSKEGHRLRVSSKSSANISTTQLNIMPTSISTNGIDEQIPVDDPYCSPFSASGGRILSTSSPNIVTSGNPLSVSSSTNPSATINNTSNSTPTTPLYSPTPPFSPKVSNSPISNVSNNNANLNPNSSQQAPPRKTLAGRWEENLKKQQQDETQQLPTQPQSQSQSPPPTPTNRQSPNSVQNQSPQPSQQPTQPHPNPNPNPNPIPIQPQSQNQTQSPQNQNLKSCPRCQKTFQEREHVVAALGQRWHVACFVCAECGTPIKGPFVNKGGIPRCLNCRPTLTHCCICNLTLQGNFFNINNRGYHESCLKCGECGKKLDQNDLVATKSGPFCADCKQKADEST